MREISDRNASEGIEPRNAYRGGWLLPFVGKTKWYISLWWEIYHSSGV